MTRPEVEIRQTRPEDFEGIQDLTRAVYPDSWPWSEEQLASHLRVFPEGQLVAVEKGTGRVLGMAASLVICWDDYSFDDAWRDVTDHGLFTNHDPENGRTLYGAEIMVHPECQGCGIGAKIYAARREIVEKLGLLRIRAGARLRGYHHHADRMSAEEYAIRVQMGELKDSTLSFQLKHGFKVIGVTSGYLRADPESRGFAAVIEWLNPKVATEEDFQRQRVLFRELKSAEQES